MKARILIFILAGVLPFCCFAHPGPGIVKDSKGNIYYTDLSAVWKINPSGIKTKVVEGVHTHLLYLDSRDNLYGEHLWYNGEQADTWGSYAWCLYVDGSLDTVHGPLTGFLHGFYSFNRDRWENQYWVQHGPVKKFFRKKQDGKIEKIAEVRLEDPGWIKVSPDGRVYFVAGNHLYQLDTSGVLSILTHNIGSITLTRPSMSDPYIAGLWIHMDRIYVADYTARQVKQVGPDGRFRVVARSDPPWSPVSGVFDNQGNLWLLENNIDNTVRVRKIRTS